MVLGSRTKTLKNQQEKTPQKLFPICCFTGTQVNQPKSSIWLLGIFTSIIYINIMDIIGETKIG